MRLFFLAIVLFPFSECFTQVEFVWNVQNLESAASFRGLSVVNDDVIWASGTKGTVAKTVNGGEKWEEFSINGAEELDLRDIHAFDENTAYALSSGDVGNIYKTIDGGGEWSKIYSNDADGIFFDGFDFVSETEGYAFSDPINGKFYIIKTTDGENWRPIDLSKVPDCLEGEVAFAASGSSIRIRDGHIYIGTGGSGARIIHSADSGSTWDVMETPLLHNESAGIFSLIFWTADNGFVVGGDYEQRFDKKGNAAFTSDGGKTWSLLEMTQPNGYRSSVSRSPDLGLMLTVGPTGTDMSSDDGRNWMFVDETPLNVCEFGSRTVWAAGPDGAVAKIKIY